MNLNHVIDKSRTVIRPAVRTGWATLQRLYRLARARQKTIPWKYQEHAFSIMFVLIVFLGIMMNIQSGEERARQQEFERVSPYLNLSALDLRKPMHKSIFYESLNVFYPQTPVRNDSLLQLVERYATEDITTLQSLTGGEEGLTWSKFGDLIWMYISFIVAYLVVMALTYYGVQTLAIYRFVRERQNSRPYLEELIHFVRASWPDMVETTRQGVKADALLRFAGHAGGLLGKAVLKAIGYLVLYSPAYVIAYSFRSGFDTDTLFFMVLLGVISNGLLITYAQKFYTFLVAESRKGYVQTAIVKNLNASFLQDSIPHRAILGFRKRFPGHIFHHIYLNARYQYILTLKEQASFLITGLIIIEMALNIHGHLSYELLQNILYRQYDVVLTILLGVFLVVKATEIAVDMWMDREALKYENMA